MILGRKRRCRSLLVVREMVLGPSWRRRGGGRLIGGLASLEDGIRALACEGRKEVGVGRAPSACLASMLDIAGMVTEATESEK